MTTADGMYEAITALGRSEGVAAIAIERRRQQASRADAGEEFSREYDVVTHTNGELAVAAVAYANRAIDPTYDAVAALEWPWDADWWKPSDDPIRNLEKAGAMLAAEIDRRRALGDA